MPLHNYTRQSKVVLNQIKWNQSRKKIFWDYIVRSKIANQESCLKLLNKEYDAKIIEGFLNSITDGDKHNREGLMAKYYFKTLFGSGFTREQENIINHGLNYGYSILLSQVTRALSARGFLLPIGIKHKSQLPTTILEKTKMDGACVKVLFLL